jgi:sulfur carrier protein|tara:strand:+ start:453 stop:656 length:204 start_codon:yes stop_codon:yes gene_type:complete
MAKIQINGRKIALKQNLSISDVLKKYKINNKKVAIELNGKIIPQNKHSKKKLKNNDKIEIVQFIGGG